MEFFNKKEDVLEIKLTQYGKYLLSKGKFKPHYYAFFDDNILYDQQYSGRSTKESQNQIEGRIQEETPALRTQYVYSGIETEIVKINEQVRSGQLMLGSDKIQPGPEKHFALSSPLGNSEIGNKNAPALGVRFLHNEISSSTGFITGSYPTLKVPQLEAHVTYETEIGSTLDGSGMTPGASGAEHETTTFPDGTFLSITPDYLLLEIKENNTDCLKENFDIEIFIIEDEDVSGSISTPGLPEATKYKKETWNPLSFLKEHEEVVDGILVEPMPQNQRISNVNANYVEYFLDVRIDNEISKDMICRSISNITPDSFFGPCGDIYDCDDWNESSTVLPTSLYGTTVTDDDYAQCATEETTSLVSGMTSELNVSTDFTGPQAAPTTSRPTTTFAAAEIPTLSDILSNETGGE